MPRAPIVCLIFFSTAIGVVAQPVRPAVNTNPEFNGKTLDQWTKEVEDNDPSVREHAIKIVSLMGPAAKKAAPALIRRRRPRARRDRGGDDR